MKTIVVLSSLLVGLAHGSSSVMQTRDSLLSTTRDTLFARAENLLARGNLIEAEKCYEAFINTSADARGYIGMGKVSLIKEDWISARQRFDEAIKMDPNSIEAYYYSAISYRESGRWRHVAGKQQGISIELAYARSLEQFGWILRRDSSYRDVLYQYSVLMKNEERFGDALRAMYAQIRLKPDLSIAWTGLVRLIRAAIHEKRNEDLMSVAHGFARGWELYMRAEELRIRGLLEEAERQFTRLLLDSTNLPPQLAYLSLTRVHAKKGQFQSLEENYWKAVAKIEDESGAGLIFDDLKHILSPREILAFSTLARQRGADQFFFSAWNRRNPTLASPSNPRLHEHYQRLVYAEEHYYLDRERFSLFYDRGWPGLDFGFTDMGRVYIRQGPPDDVIRQGGPASTSESWVYKSTDESPELVFNFYGGEKSFSTIPLGSPSVTLDVGQTHNPWAKIRSRVSIPAATDKERSGHDGLTFDELRVKAAELSELAFWDPNYFELWRASQGTEGDAAERAQRRIIENAGRTFAAGLTTDRGTSETSTNVLRLASAVSSFRAGTGKTVLEVSYVIPGAALLKESGDTLQAVDVESGFAVFDRNWRRITSVAETLHVLPSDRASDSYYRLHQTAVKPDSYHVAIYAHPLDRKVIAKSEKRVLARNFWTSDFGMSDLQLAFEIRRSEDFSIFDKEGLRVVVNPLARQALSRPMYVYFELYNATEIQRERSYLDLNIAIRPVTSSEGVFSKILGLFASEKKGYFVASQADHWKSNKALARYLVLDVTRMQPGQYTLEIMVTDIPTLKSASRTLEFELFESNR